MQSWYDKQGRIVNKKMFSGIIRIYFIKHWPLPLKFRVNTYGNDTTYKLVECNLPL